MDRAYSSFAVQTRNQMIAQDITEGTRTNAEQANNAASSKWQWHRTFMNKSWYNNALSCRRVRKNRPLS